MDEVNQKRIKTAHSLLCDMEEFISDNRHSRQVELRWLSSHLGEILPLLRQARSDNLDDVYKKLVASFRLGEIAEETAKREKEIEILNREAATLKVA